MLVKDVPLPEEVKPRLSSAEEVVSEMVNRFRHSIYLTHLAALQICKRDDGETLRLNFLNLCQSHLNLGARILVLMVVIL